MQRRDRWPVIAPDLAAHVAAVQYNADRLELSVRPESPAWATKTRLETPRLIAAANAAAGRKAVQVIRILSPGPAPVASAPVAISTEPASAVVATGPVRTREKASAGYHRAINAHRASRKSATEDPAIRAVAERQAQEQLREPEELFGEGRSALEELRTRAASVDASRARALRRLAAERAGEASGPPWSRRTHGGMGPR
ncbi:DciA family protein [Streptomyces xantholiticus]